MNPYEQVNKRLMKPYKHANKRLIKPQASLTKPMKASWYALMKVSLDHNHGLVKA
jgi:hypothetical protein